MACKASGRSKDLILGFGLTTAKLDLRRGFSLFDAFWTI